MHIPFSMSDEPDLGDEFNGMTSYEDLPEPPPMRRGDGGQEKLKYTYTQSDVDRIIQQSIKMKNEAYQDGYNRGWNEGYHTAVYR